MFHNKRNGYFIDYLSVLQDFFTISYNISAAGAIIPAEMIGAMAKQVGDVAMFDDLLRRMRSTARTGIVN
jgi:hypothetical protein